MKRRTMLKRVGSVGAASVAVAGSASAGSRPQVNLDREVDVADVSGTVSLSSILSADDFAGLSDDVDPSEVQITVTEEADTIRPTDCCCCECTYNCAKHCDIDDCCFC